MTNQEAWQLAHDAALAYEKDFVPAIFAQWPPVLAEIAGIKQGHRVLDVARGTGVLAREAATRAGSTGCVTRLDLNEGMLAVARRLRLDIDWRQGDAATLPFQDNSFDAVVSRFALMFFPDRVAALHEMWRVLAPHGQLAVAVCAPIAHSKGYTVFAGIVRQEVGNDVAVMVEGYFAHGDEMGPQKLCTAAGITGPKTLTRGGWARFASLDEPCSDRDPGFAARRSRRRESYQKVLKAARQELRGF